MRWKLTSLAIGFLLLLAGGIYIVWRGVPMLIGATVRLVPVAWEERLGSAMSEQLAQGEECQDEGAKQAVAAIAARLSKALPEGSPYTFRIRIVRNRQVNAMAAPGGYIIVYSGLVNQMGSAEELAAVLAHEMQHVVQRHSTQGILRAVGLQLLLGMLLGDAGGLADLAGNLGALHFARSDEWRADDGALENMMRAGISPKAMEKAFQHLAESTPHRTPGALLYLSTHPPIEERIAHANSRMQDWARMGQHKQGEGSLAVTLPQACAAAK